jgi:hypothetical protein
MDWLPPLYKATVYTQVRPERFSAIQVNAPILSPSSPTLLPLGEGGNVPHLLVLFGASSLSLDLKLPLHISGTRPEKGWG